MGGPDDKPLMPGIVVDRLASHAVLEPVRSVLARGSLTALEVDYQLPLFHRWYRVQPVGRDPSTPARSARELLDRLDESNASLFRMFVSARTLVIEDEYALRSHPILSPCAFVDDRVLRWRSITAEPVVAAAYLRAGPHGVPLVGYLSTLDPDDIGLRSGENLSSESVGRLANSTIAIAVPLADDDTYVVACRVEPRFD